MNNENNNLNNNLNNQNNNMNNQSNSMNNQSNNMNNQNVGQTFTNNLNQQLNPATQQFVTQNQVQAPNNQVQSNQQITNAQINNQQQLNNQYNNISQVPYNNVNMGQPTNNYNPNITNNDMGQPPYQPNTPIKKNNKKPFIIVGIAILAVIIVAAVIIILMGNKASNKTLNEYEDNNITDNSTDNNDNNQSLDTQIFKGFEFEKLSGYQYSVDTDGLSVQNSNFMLMLEVISGKYSEAVSYKQNLIDQFNNSGITVGNVLEQTISNKKLLTFELNTLGTNIIYFLTESPNENYTYQVMVANSNNDYNTSMIDEGIKICNSSKFIGNYSDYSKEFNFNFDLDKLEEE